MIDLLSAIKNRESERYFKKEKLPRSLVEQILSYAIWAPSACNLQLTEYIVVDDGKRLDTLAKKVSNKFNWSSTFIVLIIDPRFTVKRSAGIVSLGAVMQNILLAAEAFGIGACPLAGFGNDCELKKVLAIPDFYEVALIIALGYPQKEYIKDRERIQLEKVLYWNEWRDQGNKLNDSLDLSSWSIADVINYRRRMAPTYLYNHHFRLQTFSENTYNLTCELLNSKVPSFNKKKVLDLFSYDTIFARSLLNYVPQNQVTISDIIDYPLKVFKGNFPQVSSLLISDDYQFPFPSESFNIITWVHKLEFTPQPEKIFKEAKRLLKKDGLFFLTIHLESPKSRFFRKIEKWDFRYIKKERVNVYENNPFYKIGPRKIHSLNKIDLWAKSAGLIRIEVGKKNVSMRNYFCDDKFLWIIYKK